MEVVFSALIAIFFAASLYLLMSRQLIRILIGIVLLSNAVNLLIFTAGRITREIPPIIPIDASTTVSGAANPLPQALVLTAIVISFSLFAFMLVLSLRVFQELGSDNVDEIREAEPEEKIKPMLEY